MILSVLIPSIPERKNKLNILLHKLQSQIDLLPVQKEVEIIVLMDNKVISIGEKRERLKNLAGGKYFCFLDDDDDITHNYIEELYNACNGNNVDVVTFNTWATIDGQEGSIIVNIEHENEQFKPGGDTLRKPSHVNAWLTEKFKQFHFSDKNYGEDFDFCEQCYPHIEDAYNIGKTLHYYTYDKDITRAF